MTLEQRINSLELQIKTAYRKIARLEEQLKPTEKKKRKSSYVPKIKITKPLTKSEIYQRIDERFMRKVKRGKAA